MDHENQVIEPESLNKFKEPHFCIFHLFGLHPYKLFYCFNLVPASTSF